MKYLIPFIVLVFIALAHPATAQQNDSMARVSFTMAEGAYANGQYKDAVTFVKYAEIYSGGANSRSLYIKIKALDQLVNTDATNLPTLQSALDRFFEVTDKSTYPNDKYQEISGIMGRRKNPSSGGAVIPATTNKNAQEAADYEIAIKKNTIEAYKEFLDTYSYTPHHGEIKRRYDELVEDAKEYRNHRIHH